MRITWAVIGKKGFSLLELIIVISLTIVIIAIGLPLYNYWLVNTETSQTASQISEMIRTAQLRSFAGWQDSSNGIYFTKSGQADKLVLFKGEAYSLRDPAYDEEIIATNDIVLNKDFESNEIVFIKNTGLPSSYGHLSVTNNASHASFSFTMNKFGMIFPDN